MTQKRKGDTTQSMKVYAKKIELDQISRSRRTEQNGTAFISEISAFRTPAAELT